MEENKSVETQTTSTETVETNEVKTFTQEEMDHAISSRVNRTKEALAKKLGIESYSDEALESFVSDYKEKGTKITELETTVATNQSILFDKDLRIEALELGVKPENYDKVSKLVKTDMQDNTELDVKQALTQVLEDYPFFKGEAVQTTPPKVGVQTKTEQTSLNEVDAYMSKYKGSKYFK